MTEDPSKRHPRDATRVNIHEYWEIDYWCRHFKCTRAQLIVTVHTVGPMAESVERFLREVLRPPQLEAMPVRVAPPPVRAPDPPPTV